MDVYPTCAVVVTGCVVLLTAFGCRFLAAAVNTIADREDDDPDDADWWKRGRPRED